MRQDDGPQKMSKKKTRLVQRCSAALVVVVGFVLAMASNYGTSGLEAVGAAKAFASIPVYFGMDSEHAGDLRWRIVGAVIWGGVFFAFAAAALLASRRRSRRRG